MPDLLSRASVSQATQGKEMTVLPYILACLPLFPAQERRTANVSAYCRCSKCCFPYDGTKTASGTKPHYGTIAAPRNIPFGTRIHIPGYGLGTVEDRGGAIKENRLDVFFPDDKGKPGSGHRKALRWERKSLVVTIIQTKRRLPK